LNGITANQKAIICDFYDQISGVTALNSLFSKNKTRAPRPPELSQVRGDFFFPLRLTAESAASNDLILCWWDMS
jgi:hypothetical protein